MTGGPKSSVYHGHLVLVCTFIFNFVAIGVFNASGLYIDPLSSTFPDSSTGVIAFYCSIQIVAGLTSSFVAGVLQEVLDKRGIGVRWLFFSGGVFMALGFFTSSLSHTIYGVLSGSVLMGIGLGFGGFTAPGICVLWFEAARGMMLLLAMSGQGLGSVCISYATARLLEMHEGEDDPWRPTMRWMGVMSFVLCAIASFPMRMPVDNEVEEYEGVESEDGSDRTSLTGKDYGSLETSNNATNVPKRRTSVMAMESVRAETGHGRRSHSYPAPNERQRASLMLGSFQALGNAPLLTLDDFQGGERRPSIVQEEEEEAGFTLQEVTWTRTNVCLNIFSVIVCFAIQNMIVLLPPYIASLGLPPSVGGRVLVSFGVGDFLSNLTLGVVADQIGARRLLAYAFLILSTLFFAWPHLSTLTSLATVAFLYGYLVCTISSMPVIILADAFSDSSSELVLQLNGFSNMIKFPGYLFGPFLAGEVVQWVGGSYDLAANLSGLLILIGAIALLMIPSPDDQRMQLVQNAAREL